MAIPGRNKKSKSLLPSRTSLASIESLTMPLVQEVVFQADFRCAECQKRVAEIISRMNGEPESVMVSVLEKKVTLTCRSLSSSTIGKTPSHRLAAAYKKQLNKVAMITRLFCSSSN